MACVFACVPFSMVHEIVDLGLPDGKHETNRNPVVVVDIGNG